MRSTRAALMRYELLMVLPLVRASCCFGTDAMDIQLEIAAAVSCICCEARYGVCSRLALSFLLMIV